MIFKKINKINIGKQGEDFACRYLIKNGYRIIERNYREKFGEIDAIAKKKDGTLVFFEVKTLKEGDRIDLLPEDNATKSKLTKVRKICEMFSNLHPELIDEKRGWQIDLLAVVISGSEFSVRHYENI